MATAIIRDRLMCTPSPAGGGVKLVQQVGRERNLDSPDRLAILRLADGHAPMYVIAGSSPDSNFALLPILWTPPSLRRTARDTSSGRPWNRVNGACAVFKSKYHFGMTAGPGPIGSASHLDTDEQAWLHARLAEYQGLLAYLRDR